MVPGPTGTDTPAAQVAASTASALTVYGRTFEQALPLQDKHALAQALITLIVEQYHHEKKH